MSKQIAISIIVPVYNAEKYLGKCLKSLTNQTLKNIEIICINDGSKDRSAKILSEFSKKDDRIIIINQKNSGLCVARNIGLDNAKGKYIGFVDSDDFVDIDFYEKLYNSAIKHKADIIASGIIRFNKFKSKKYLKIKKEIITNNFKEKCKILDIPEKCYVWNKIYLLEKFEKFNFRFKENILYEDMYFTPQVLKNLKTLVTVPNTYYHYRKNPKSIVYTKCEKKEQDYKTGKKWVIDFLKDNGINLDEQLSKTKKYKILGLTVFKKRIKANKTTYNLFSIIKWSKTTT